MHADRSNRSALVVLAVVLIVVGVFGVLVGSGQLTTPAAHDALLHNGVADFIGKNSSWFWPVVAVVAAIVVLLMLRWVLAVLFSTDRAGDLPIRTHAGPGQTTLTAGALTGAVGEEVSGYRGVTDARARLTGDPHSPHLMLRVTVEESADIAALRDRLDNEALTHARTALDQPDLPARVDLTVSSRPGARVR